MSYKIFTSKDYTIKQKIDMSSLLFEPYDYNFWYKR